MGIEEVTGDGEVRPPLEPSQKDPGWTGECPNLEHVATHHSQGGRGWRENPIELREM